MRAELIVRIENPSLRASRNHPYIPKKKRSKRHVGNQIFILTRIEYRAGSLYQDATLSVGLPEAVEYVHSLCGRPYAPFRYPDEVTK